MNSKKLDSRNLDLLRAVAVLCVFVAHLTLTLLPNHHVFETVHTPEAAYLYTLGEIGVLLFFVHTSLVLLMSLERTSRRPLFLNFYIRRIFRIYPLSVACIGIVILLRIPYVPGLPFVAPDARTIVSNLLLVQNLTNTKDIISPLWTLPREVQMYAVLPVLFLALRWAGSVPFVIFLWAAGAFGVNQHFAPAQIPSFMGGAFAYQLGRRITGRVPGALWPVALLALIGAQLWLRHEALDRFIPRSAICMVVGGLIPMFRDLRDSWLTNACHIVAKYSYGIYLFHLPAIWFAFDALRGYPAWLQWLSLILLMIFVPWLAFVFLEAPLIEAGRRIANRFTKSGARDPEPAIVAALQI